MVGRGGITALILLSQLGSSLSLQVILAQAVDGACHESSPSIILSSLIYGSQSLFSSSISDIVCVNRRPSKFTQHSICKLLIAFLHNRSPNSIIKLSNSHVFTLVIHRTRNH